MIDLTEEYSWKILQQTTVNSFIFADICLVIIVINVHCVNRSLSLVNDCHRRLIDNDRCKRYMHVQWMCYHAESVIGIENQDV